MVSGHEINKHWVEAVISHDDRILWYQIDGNKYTPEEARNGNDGNSPHYVGEIRLSGDFFKDKYSDLSSENKKLFDSLPKITE